MQKAVYKIILYSIIYVKTFRYRLEVDKSCAIHMPLAVYDSNNGCYKAF